MIPNASGPVNSNSWFTAAMHACIDCQVNKLTSVLYDLTALEISSLSANKINNWDLDIYRKKLENEIIQHFIVLIKLRTISFLLLFPSRCLPSSLQMQ